MGEKSPSEKQLLSFCFIQPGAIIPVRVSGGSVWMNMTKMHLFENFKFYTLLQPRDKFHTLKFSKSQPVFPFYFFFCFQPNTSFLNQTQAGGKELYWELPKGDRELEEVQRHTEAFCEIPDIVEVTKWPRVILGGGEEPEFMDPCPHSVLPGWGTGKEELSLLNDGKCAAAKACRCAHSWQEGTREIGFFFPFYTSFILLFCFFLMRTVILNTI